MDCELFCYDMVLRWVFWGNWQRIGGVDLGGLSISVTWFKEEVENVLELESLPNMDPKTPLFTLCSQNQQIWWTTCNAKLVGRTPAKLGKQVFWKHCNHNRLSFSFSHRWLHIHNKLCSWASFLCDYIGPPTLMRKNKRSLIRSPAGVLLSRLPRLAQSKLEYGDKFCCHLSVHALLISQ